MLDGIIDVYLPDMKYNDNQVAEQYSHAPDYVKVNRAAIQEMHRQVGSLVRDETGVALRGLIIRHLVLPQGLAGSEGIMKFIAEEISKDTAISLMSQYFPARRASEFPGTQPPHQRGRIFASRAGNGHCGLDRGMETGDLGEL